MNEACHIWMRHVTYEWGMSHLDEASHTWMSHMRGLHYEVGACQFKTNNSFRYIHAYTHTRETCMTVYTCLNSHSQSHPTPNAYPNLHPIHSHSHTHTHIHTHATHTHTHAHTNTQAHTHNTHVYTHTRTSTPTHTHTPLTQVLLPKKTGGATKKLKTRTIAVLNENTSCVYKSHIHDYKHSKYWWGSTNSPIFASNTPVLDANIIYVHIYICFGICIYIYTLQILREHQKRTIPE